jgi:hypothetical protein
MSRTGVSATGARTILAANYELGDAVETFWFGYNGVFPGTITGVYLSDKIFIIKDDEKNDAGVYETTVVPFDEMEKHEMKALPSTLARFASSGMGTSTRGVPNRLVS